jgi:hypothetical protein
MSDRILSHETPTRTPAKRRSPRDSRRGTLLVVVLGLLVALFVIGTSFSFVTLTERRAAANYLDRQRALDLALDGVEYTIARLRAEVLVDHYEGLSDQMGGIAGGAHDPRLYAMHPVDSDRPTVSWSRSASRTSGVDTPDGNWVDFDGDGRKSGDEQAYGTEKIPSTLQLGGGGFASRVTGFRADGISTWQVQPDAVPRVENRNYGVSGTYEELGDTFSVRVIDAASMLNLNNYHGDDYERVLMILGEAIDAWVNNDQPRGEDNPFPPQIALEMRELAESQGWWLENKDVFRPIFARYPNGDRLFELGMNFVTVASWHDEFYRDYVKSNLRVVQDGNPREYPDQIRMRAGMSIDAQNGQEGWPDWHPEPSHFGKAPVNINTAPRPVLIAMLAGLEANARLLYFQRQDRITEPDSLVNHSYNNQEVPQMRSGTTDLGRQNNAADSPGTGIMDESFWNPGSISQRAIFQLVPIGPIETMFGRGVGQTDSAGRAEHAGALADEIIRLRTIAPFQSWQDFDARFFRETLLRVPNTNRNNVTVPDVVGVNRSSLSRNVQVDSAYPIRLLPDPGNVEHPANPIRSGEAGMSGQDFRAWYWKSVVDMLRAALAPSNMSNRYNSDYPYHMNVDRSDLVYSGSHICFSSMGVYEVVSLGDVYSPPRATDRRTAVAGADDDRRPVARRKVRSVIRIYDVWQHTSQEHFMLPVDPADVTRGIHVSPDDDPETMVAHTKFWSKSGPFSIDERSNGSWANPAPTELRNRMQAAEDARRIGYGRPGSLSGQPGSEPIDRFKGHNNADFSSGHVGWVMMDPLDRTPFEETEGRNPALNFHARFNESLRARSLTQGEPQGVLSDNHARYIEFGHIPLETGVIFEDFVSSATPRSTIFDYGGAEGTERQSQEFQVAHQGSQATIYSSLRPDGVFLGGGSLRIREESRLRALYNRRGVARPPRLKILRYPNGSHFANRPFMPAQPADNSLPYGIDDRELERNPYDAWTDPYSGMSDITRTRKRLNGINAPWRGLDPHNRAVQRMRQRRTNMPYYEGTVDFWIKWDLPPQGSDRSNVVASLGDVDPTSLNFSGLFGATAFGRFQDAMNQGVNYNDSRWNNPQSQQRDASADFEGVQFFVFKEPGGFLRFSRMYFSEAFGANIEVGATGSTPTTVTRFGSALRRIVDEANIFGGFTATGDICNTSGDGSSVGDDMGFLFSRTDAWVDLSAATYAQAQGARFVLRTHDWHRFTLSYNSNTNSPYHLWINGRKINGVVFHDDPDGLLGFRNDGSHRGPGGVRDTEIPETSASNDEYIFLRTTVRLLEINPEDRLTVGCIFRRQVDIASSQWWSDYYDTANEPDQGNLSKPPRPLFKFDSNLVAVANATIDDFRISSRLIPATTINVSEGAARNASRYMPKTDPWANRTYYEGGFLPIRDEDGQLYGQPVRLGTIAWTELRPDWDPYRARGLDLNTSSRLRFEWAVFENYRDVELGGAEHNLQQQRQYGTHLDLNDTEVSSPRYWARGGMSLNNALMPSGSMQTGLLVYRVYFQVGDEITVNNVTPFLLDVTVTVLSPPQKTWFMVEY